MVLYRTVLDTEKRVVRNDKEIKNINNQHPLVGTFVAFFGQG